MTPSNTRRRSARGRPVRAGGYRLSKIGSIRSHSSSGSTHIVGNDLSNTAAATATTLAPSSRRQTPPSSRSEHGTLFRDSFLVPVRWCDGIVTLAAHLTVDG